MCHTFASSNWVKKHLTETLVKKFHRRKRNRRAFNKLYKRRDYFQSLGSSVGVVFSLGIHPKPSLLVKKIKVEETEDSEQILYKVDLAAAC
jgi:hypothetical protein